MKGRQRQPYIQASRTSRVSGKPPPQFTTYFSLLTSQRLLLTTRSTANCATPCPLAHPAPTDRSPLGAAVSPNLYSSSRYRALRRLCASLSCQRLRERRGPRSRSIPLAY